VTAFEFGVEEQSLVGDDGVVLELPDVDEVGFEEVEVLVLHLQDLHCVHVATRLVYAPLHHSVPPLTQHLLRLERLLETAEALLRPLRKLLLEGHFADHAGCELQRVVLGEGWGVIASVHVLGVGGVAGEGVGGVAGEEGGGEWLFVPGEDGEFLDGALELSQVHFAPLHQTASHAR
jgi:hypothetical protein